MTKIGQQVRRATLAGAWTKISFEGAESRRFRVLNFSEGDIYVSLTPDITDTGLCFKIPSGKGEDIAITESAGYYQSAIWVTGTGEVEVQMADWRRVRTW